MNGMNFKPFIHKVLDSLSDTDISFLAALIDSHSNSFTNKSLVLGNLTDDNKGVGLFTIQLDSQTIKTGYLLFNDSYCVLLNYVSNSERIVEYNIDITHNTYTAIKEYLTTDYLRHAVQLKAARTAYTTTNITELSDDLLNKLRCGDTVIKLTENQCHTYTVTYKEAAVGICLSYFDASGIETVSYDYTEGHWVYNSTDKGSF